jgi:hypothetical protein
MSWTTERRSFASRGAGRVATSATATAPTTNVDASSRNAAPVPNVAITTPPSAGPANRNASGFTLKSAEFACTSRSGGTSCGTIEPNAGPANAWPSPNSATITHTCQSTRSPLIASTPIPVAASARTTSATMITCRRSNLSAATPPSRMNATIEPVWIAPATPIAAGEFESS